MAKKTVKKTEEVSEEELDAAIKDIIDEKPVEKLGIIKTYTQNGFRYQRMRHEGGRIEDVRI